MGKKKPKGGGGGAVKPALPTAWIYDREGNPVKLVPTATWQKQGKTDVQVPLENYVPSGFYVSPDVARQKNPKVWIYDQFGKATRQVFKGGEGPDEEFDTALYNLGPDATPYRHWYDEYGVSQKYAPVSTPIGEGFYEATYLAPRSPDYRAPVPLNKVNPALQPSATATPEMDIATARARARKRRAGPSLAGEADGGIATTGGGAGKTLIGE